MSLRVFTLFFLMSYLFIDSRFRFQFFECRSDGSKITKKD